MARNCKFWTAEDDANLVRCIRDEGTSFADAQQHFPGRTPDSLRSRYSRLTIQGAPSVAIDPEVKKTFDDASQRAELNRMAKRLAELESQHSPKRVPVETEAVPVSSTRERWLQWEEDSDRRKEHARQRSRFHVRFEDGPIAVAFVSDQHIAPGTPVDFRRMREDAELIQSTEGLYACLGGDGVDNHIKHRAAVLAARSQPGDQWELYEWYLQIFADKIVALISGNHDAWTDQVAGIDMVQQIAARNRLCYCPAEAFIRLQVVEQTYKLAFRHQYRFNSSYNLGHTVKQWWRMGEEDFDVGVICHHHEPSIESFEAHGQTRWAARPGAYQITSSYSRQYGFNSTAPTCPTFILFPDERRIIGFRDVRDAVKTLKAERA